MQRAALVLMTLCALQFHRPPLLEMITNRRTDCRSILPGHDWFSFPLDVLRPSVSLCVLEQDAGGPRGSEGPERRHRGEEIRGGGDGGAAACFARLLKTNIRSHPVGQRPLNPELTATAMVLLFTDGRGEAGQEE